MDFEDLIKVPNQLTLRYGVYPRGLGLTARVFLNVGPEVRDGEGQKRVIKIPCAIGSLMLGKEGGGRGPMAKNLSGVSLLKAAAG